MIVVVGAEHLETAQRLLAAAGVDATLCAGGTTRTDSVAAGLVACRDLGAEPADLVGIHDAARPLATAALIARTFAAVGDGWNAAAPGLPVVDTVKLVEHDKVVRTVDRRGLWTVQTPQVFEWATLERAYRGAGLPPVTDDLALVEGTGGRVRIILGEASNLKITYPQDLAMAEVLRSGALAP